MTSGPVREGWQIRPSLARPAPNLIHGNRIRLLKDSAENYPARVSAVESAERYIYFETFVIHEDEVGRRFANLLIAKAWVGVRVLLIYDWVGGFGMLRTPTR
jgi:cardiolipin synthase